MKKMKSLLNVAAAAVVLFLSSNEVNAQATDVDSRALRLGVGLSAGIPTTSGYDFAFGGDVRLQKDFVSNVSGTLSVGYNSFSLDDDLAVDNLGYIPVKVGLKVFPVKRFYFSGEVGAAFGTDSDSNTSFVYAPGIGVGTNTGIDIGLRYEGMTGNAGTLGLKNPGQVALRLAYGFNLN